MKEKNQNIKLLLDKLKKFIISHRLINRDETVLCAVSGGSDSIAMLHLLAQLRGEIGFKIEVAYINHGLRPEAWKEAEYVRKQAEKLSCPFHLRKADVKTHCEQTGRSIESSARYLRYNLLKDIAAQINAKKIATAHTMDDQAETTLMKIIRGCGLEGLRAMRPIRDGLYIKPLLQFSRTQLQRFLESSSIEYFTDISNFSDEFFRVRVRKKLIPEIERENPGIKNLLCTLAEESSEAVDFLSSIAKDIIHNEIIETDEGFEFEIKKLLSLHTAVASEVMRLLLRRFLPGLEGIYRNHLKEIYKIMHSNKPSSIYMVPGEIIFEKRYEKMLIYRKSDTASPPPSRYELRIDRPGIFTSEELRVNISISKTFPPVFFPVTLRRRRTGDRLARRKKKLKKFLIDRKIPMNIRNWIPLITKGNNILWIYSIYCIADCKDKVRCEPMDKTNPFIQWVNNQNQ